MCPSFRPLNSSGSNAFLSILPRIKRHASIFFRHIRCQGQRDDCIAETIALAWGWFVRMAQRGKDASSFASVFACLAARAVRSGRRLCGQTPAQDALSPIAQQRHGFTISSLPQASSLDGNAFDEALVDNTQTPPDEQASFRIDFSAWRSSRSDRDSHLIDDLMIGRRTCDVARRYGLTPGRVSRLRREFHDDWQGFTAKPARR
jgi:hypothetical protein